MMNSVIRQFRRISSDDGRDDKDFSVQEERLAQSHKRLREAADLLTRASEILRGVLLDRPVKD